MFTQNLTDRSTPSAKPAHLLFPIYLFLFPCFIQAPEEETKEGTQKESSRALLSTSLVLCRFFSLSKNSKVSFL